MNPQHFGSNPADTRIRIRINPEIQIRILDQFRSRLDALAEVCTLSAQSNYSYYDYYFVTRLLLTIFNSSAYT